MARDRSLRFLLYGEDKTASKTFDQVGKKSDGLGKKFAGLGAAAKGGIAGAIGGSAIIAGKEIFGLAARMEQLDAKAQTVFGPKALTGVQKWAKANAGAMGLSSKEAVGLAAGFADLLKPMGFTADQAATMSTQTIGLAGALSSWSGGQVSATEAADRLSAAMLGETDGLKELGISISAADVEAKLAAKGQSKLTGAALEQAKAVATQQLIMEKSTDAQAAYAKSGDTLAGKQARLTSKMKELRDQGLARLVPLLTQAGTYVQGKVVPAFARLFQGFNQGAGYTTYLKNILGGLRSAFDSVRGSIERNRPQLESLARGFAKVAGVVYGVMGPVLRTQFTIIGKVLGTAIDTVGRLVSAFQKIGQLGGSLFSGIKEGFRSAINFIIDKWNGLSFTVGGFDPPGPGSFPSVTVGTPDIPRLADGGIVRARPGGTLALVGEGGRDEAVIPLSRSGSRMGGGPTVVVHVHGVVTNDMDRLARQIAEPVRRELVRSMQSGKRLGLA